MEIVKDSSAITPQEKLDFLLRISDHLQQREENWGNILAAIVDEIITISGADQGYLFRCENAGLVPVLQRTNNAGDIPQHEIMIPMHVLNRSLQENQVFFVTDTQTDDRFRNILSVAAFHLSSFICIPISNHHQKEGLLYLQRLDDKTSFQRDHLEIIRSVVPTLELLMENTKMQAVEQERGRIQREMQMARDVQRSLIPDAIPQYKGWKTAVCWQPAFEVGGDFYDFIPISDHLLGLVIADVSDKGMPAALFMALARTIMRAVVGGQTGSAADMITRANTLIHRDAREEMFVTLFLGLLDLENGSLTYVNAGHNPPLLYDGKNDRVVQLKPTGMAMGIDEQAKYEQKMVRIDEGDFLFLYTDGALDAVIRNKVFDEKELHAFIRRHRNADPLMIVNLLRKKICEENSAPSSQDDLTMLVWKRITTAEAL